MKKILLCPPLIAPISSWRYCPYHMWKFSFSSGDHGYSGINAPISLISAFLRSKGIKVDILDAFFENLSFEETLKRVKNYDIIGITVHSNVNLADIIKLIKMIKEISSQATIILGGHYPTYFPEKTLRETGADFIVRGEGEISLFELIKCIEDKGDLSKIDGISYLKRNKIINNKPRKKIEDIDIIPFMSRDYIERELKYKFVPGISSSRGCEFSGCTFCDICTFQKASIGENWRARSAKNVVDEIEYITKTWQFKKFKFLDPNFIGGKKGKKRAEEIAEEIIKRNLDVEYMFDTRVDEIDEELFKKLYRSGLKMVYLGIETVNQRQLLYFNKGSTVEMNDKAVQTLRRIGIIPLFGIIVFEPTTTIEEIRKNLDYFESNGGFNIYRFVRGIIPRFATPLMKRFEREGRLIEDFPDYRYKFDRPEVEKLFKVSDDYAQKVFLVEKKYKAIILKKIKYSELSIENRELLCEYESNLKDLTLSHFKRLLFFFEENNLPKDQFLKDLIDSFEEELEEIFICLDKDWQDDI